MIYEKGPSTETAELGVARFNFWLLTESKKKSPCNSTIENVWTFVDLERSSILCKEWRHPAQIIILHRPRGQKGRYKYSNPLSFQSVKKTPELCRMGINTKSYISFQSTAVSSFTRDIKNCIDFYITKELFWQLVNQLTNGQKWISGHLWSLR